MDVICGKCGKHFSSIESAREHSGYCKAISKGEAIHWVSPEKSKISPVEWDALIKSLTPADKLQTPDTPATQETPHQVTKIECSKCGQLLYYYPQPAWWKCKNCNTIYTHDELFKAPSSTKNSGQLKTEAPKHEDRNTSPKAHNPDYNPHPWLLALLLTFTASILGLVMSLILGNSSPFIILLGLSIIFSVEHWFYSQTIKHRLAARSYKIFLNLLTLYLLGLMFWSGIKLFSKTLSQSPLAGSIVFIAELVCLVVAIRLVQKYRRRWPSMKLTFFTLSALFLILAFAGVEPLSTYKDEGLSKIKKSFSSIDISPQAVSTKPDNVVTPPTPPVTRPTSITQPIISMPTPVVVIPPVSIIPPMAPATTITSGTPSTVDRSTFQAIDQYALGTPESVTKSIDSLAAYLVRPAKNDFEKARAIYRWVTQNIAYDFSAYLTKNYGSTRAEDVLVSRSSICEGYSGLFNALAKSAGLEVVTISGWAKGYSYSAGDQIAGPTNHAWNAIKINGGWYLIDSTWGAGSIDEQRFVREFDEAYFMTPPGQFIYNHLPEDSKWQLLSTPFSRNEFSASPYVHSRFFGYGLNLGGNTQSVINAGGSLTMAFPVTNDTYLIAGLRQGNVDLPRTLTSAQRAGNQYQISATFPNSGTYILSIFARKNDEFGMYEGVLEYKVLVGTTR